MSDRLKNLAKEVVDSLGKAVSGRWNITYELLEEVVRIYYNDGAGHLAESYSESEIREAFTNEIGWVGFELTGKVLTSK